MSSFLKAPSFPVLASYIAGLLFPPDPASALAAGALIFIAAFYCVKRKIAGWGIFLAAFSFFVHGQIIQTSPAYPPDLSHVYYQAARPQKLELVGVVDSLPAKLERKTRIIVKGERLYSGKEWLAVSGDIRIDLYGEAPDLRYGDRVRFSKVKLSRPRNFRNPGAFDYAGYLQKLGIHVIGWCGEKDSVEVLARNQGWKFWKAVYNVKDRMESYAGETMSPRNASLFNAMVFGEKGDLSSEDNELFIKTGIAHLTAVSGLNIGFVAFTSYFVLNWTGIRFLIRFFPRAALAGWSGRLAALASIVPVLFYALIVGEMVSSIRAAIMGALFLLSIAIRRGHFHYYTLATSALAILLWKPGSLFDAAFQLSFAAVFFIIFLFSNWLKLPEDAYSPLTSTAFEEFMLKHKYLSGYFFTSLFAAIGALPLTAFHFNRVNPLGLFINLLAVPISNVIVTLGLFLTFLSLFLYQAASWLAFVPEFCAALLVRIAEGFAVLPLASVRVSTPSPGLIIAYYWMVIAATIFKKNIKKALLVSLPALLLLPFFPGAESRHDRGGLAVTFLDVGQGDSALVRFPNGKTMLIDGGRLFGDMDLGKWVVGPFIWDVGVGKVDYLVASHPDSDHIGGLLYILDEFETGILYENGDSSKNKYMEGLREAAKSREIPVRALKSGDLLQIDGAVVEVLNPGEISAGPQGKKEEKENNRSLVLRVGCGEVSFLFTGDIEYGAEAAMINSGKGLHSTIIKVPHHGSATSSSMDFIKAVQPEVAVMSVGADNMFGHPETKVWGRYKKSGAMVLSTAHCGAIEIFTDCKTYRVKTSVDCADIGKAE
ncbi:MAG: DNA internalization-related competence protein ComEC/Rec2 [Nitrospinae bacterium]|nr:DNA internalization-related competence protein ComEC/Rec2 [Nitrospinota bacterium]